MNKLLKDLSPMGAAYHLEQLYEEIRVTRMADIPILNEKLKVQAVGFRAWNDYVIGVLVTPWFMNLMLLPTDTASWTDLKIGQKRNYAFEAGSFEFILGEEESLGKYMSCSMFSPMFEFADHSAAVQTAEAIVAGMFKEENKEELEGQCMNADENTATEGNDLGVMETVVTGAQAIGSLAQENLGKPMSRRELLRGGFFRKNKDSKQGVEKQE